MKLNSGSINCTLRTTVIPCNGVFEVGGIITGPPRHPPDRGKETEIFKLWNLAQASVHAEEWHYFLLLKGPIGVYSHPVCLGHHFDHIHQKGKPDYSKTWSTCHKSGRTVVCKLNINYRIPAYFKWKNVQLKYA